MKGKQVIAAGTMLGMGMGGFIDGIIFHQVFQTHSMLSSRLPQDDLINVKVSMVWDGMFHMLTWIFTAIGLNMLWQAAKAVDRVWSGRMMWGALIMGWGIFNFVEGLIDHYLLGIHHVVERLGLSVYDHLYIGSGLLFVIAGYFLIRDSNKQLRSFATRH